MNTPTPLDTESIVFNKERYKVQALENYTFNWKEEVNRDEINGVIKQTLYTEIYSRIIGSVNKTFVIKYPSTWWQHFKQDCFPKWLLKHFPIKYHIESKNVEMELKELLNNKYKYLSNNNSMVIYKMKENEI